MEWHQKSSPPARPSLATKLLLPQGRTCSRCFVGSFSPLVSQQVLWYTAIEIRILLSKCDQSHRDVLWHVVEDIESAAVRERHHVGHLTLLGVILDVSLRSWIDPVRANLVMSATSANCSCMASEIRTKLVLHERQRSVPYPALHELVSVQPFAPMRSVG